MLKPCPHDTDEVNKNKHRDTIIGKLLLVADKATEANVGKQWKQRLISDIGRFRS